MRSWRSNWRADGFGHLLVHVVLPYSNWEWARLVYYSEVLSLTQERTCRGHFLVKLGSCLCYGQSDQSSTATHVQGRGAGRSGREP